MYADFTNCLTNVLWLRVQSWIPHYIQLLYFFSILSFDRFSVFVFHDLDAFQNTVQLFCRKSLNLVLSDVSSWLSVGYVILARIPQKWCCVSARCTLSEDVRWQCASLLVMLTSITWLRWFLHCRVTTFFFAVNYSVLWGHTLRLCKYTIFFPSYFIASIDDSCLEP